MVFFCLVRKRERERDLVHGIRETIEIVDGGIAKNSVDRWKFGVPMSRDDQNRFGFLLENVVPP